jgi:hypothetical protein
MDKRIFIGHVIDRLGDGRTKTVATTRRYYSYADAESAAERLCNSKYGKSNDRYMRIVE